MKKYLSFILIFTILITLPLSSFAEDTSLNDEINTLNTENNENLKNSEAPYLVDLSDYFGADIFYDTEDTGSDIGMIPKSAQYAFPRSVLTGNTNISKGIISSSASNVTQSYGYDTSAAMKVKDADFRAFLGDTPLSFDVSATLKNGNSAVMLPNNTSSTENCVQTISGVFSSKTSKYLSVLVASPHDKYWFEAIVNFADGTSKQYFVNSANTSYAGRIKTFAGLEALEKKYTAGSGWADGANNIKIATFALELDAELGKEIKSVDIYRTDYNRQENPDVWQTTGFSKVANVPVLAMTEIPIKNQKFIEDIALSAWDSVKDFGESDYIIDNIDKIQNITRAYNEALVRGLAVDEIFVYEDGTSGVEKIKEMCMLVLTATSVTTRTRVDEIKSEINFNIPATKIEENITVAKNGNDLEAGVDYSIISSDDGLSAEIAIPVTKNGGDIYTFTVSGNISLMENPSMTMGSDHIYSYSVPDYMNFSYGGKVINNADEPAVNVTVAAVALGTDGKTVYATDSDLVSEVLKNSPYDANVAFDSEAILDKEYESVSYIFDNEFKLISNDSNVSVVTATTDDNANYKIPHLNLVDNTLTLKGFTPSKESNRVVNLKVYDSTQGKDVYYGSVKTNEDGYFIFEIAFPTDIYKNSFNMKFTLGGDDFSSPDTSIADVYFSTPFERQALSEYIMNADDKADLVDGENLNGEKVTVERIKREFALEFEPLSVVTDDAFAQLIINLFSELQEAPLLDEANKLFKQAAVLAAYMENKHAYVYKDGEFLYEDIMLYSRIDDNTVTLYDIFENNVYIDGKDKIVEKISGVEYKNLNELYDALKKAIFVEALNHPSQFGTSYVEDVLTTANASAVGADISKYTNSTNKSSYENAIVENSGKFTDVKSVVDFINNYTVPTPPPSTPSYSSGNSSSSSASSSFSASGFNTQDDSANGPYVKPQPQPEVSSVFSDVSPSYWAYGNIISLYNKGIVSGKGNNVFEPEGYVTRGEVAKMICVAYNLTNKAATPFADIEGKWYSDYAAICYANDLINGVNETYFGGDEKITRQDLCTILYRLKNGEETSEINFADKDEIADYAKSAVAFMNKSGIVNGFSDNTFKPHDYCTRAQMSKIFDLFLGL